MDNERWAMRDGQALLSMGKVGNGHQPLRSYLSQPCHALLDGAQIQTKAWQETLQGGPFQGASVELMSGGRHHHRDLPASANLPPGDCGDGDQTLSSLTLRIKHQILLGGPENAWRQALDMNWYRQLPCQEP